MYKFEIRWMENHKDVSFPLTHFKGFTSEDRYRKFLKKLQKKATVFNIKTIEA